MTQELAILKYLKRGLSITPIQALNKFGCFRLSSVIHDLRRVGYEIEMKLVDNQNGKKYGRYRMVYQNKKNIELERMDRLGQKYHITNN